MKKIFAAVIMCHVAMMVHPVQAECQTPVDYHRDKSLSEIVLPPSPESLSQTKYADIPFTHSTGMAELSVPIYVLEGRELTIPISLDYRSGGIKVDEVGGVAGLGWILSAGGCVTREVVYLPDEYQYQGRSFYAQPSGQLLTNLINQATTNETRDYLKSILWNQVDCGSDRYRYSLAGYKGTFIFTPEGEIKHLSGDGVGVSCTRDSSGAILSFTLVGPDGTVYTLSEREMGSRKNTPVNPTPFTGVSVNWTAPTAWYLTRIDSRDGLEYATMSYKPAVTWVQDTESHTQTWSASGGEGYVNNGSHGGPVASQTESEHSVKALASISLGGSMVQFTYASENSQSSYAVPGYVTAWNYPYRLTGITVSCPEHPELLNVTVQTARGASNRVVLNGLQIKRNGVLDDWWSFNYKTNGGGTNRYSQDWFGYCNGETNRFNLLPYGFAASSYIPTLMYGYPNASEAAFMMLTKANHNGAVTEFEYEGNTVFSGNNQSSIGVRVKKITVKDGTQIRRIRRFTYSEPQATAGCFPNRSLYSTVSVQQEYDTHHAIGIPIGVHYNWMFTMHDSPVIAGPSLPSSRVLYGRVVEDVTGPDLTEGSVRTVYEYETSGVMSWTNTSDRFPSTWSSLYNSVGLTINPMSSVPAGYGEERERKMGLLKRREEWRWTGSGYELSESEDWTYEFPLSSSVLTEYMVHQVMHRVNSAGGDVHPDDLYHYPVWSYTQPDLSHSRVVRVGYHEHGNDTTIIYRGYLPRSSFTKPNRLSQESTTAGGVSRDLGYIYADTWMDGPSWKQTLQEQHALSEPLVKQYLYFRPYEDQGMQVGHFDRWKRLCTSYGSVTIGGTSRLLPLNRVETTVADDVESWREEYLSYDCLGNVSSFKERGRPQTVVLWSYNGKYPVAIVENATISDVIQAYGGQTDLDSLTRASILTAYQITRLENLRALPSAHVTTMTYDPGAGLTSVTDPSGVRTSYEYDSGGRLASIKDADGCTMDSYIYNLLNQGTNRMSVRHKQFRTETGAVSADDVIWWNTLGMKLEDISIGASGQGLDLVAAYEGDYALHDDVRSWLPYPVSGTQGQYQTGAAAQAASYHSNPRAYNYKKYEVSPSGRMEATALPGYQGEHESTITEDGYRGQVMGLPELVWEDGRVVRKGLWSRSELVEENVIDADSKRVSVTKDRMGRTLAIAKGGAEHNSTFVLIGDNGPEVHGDPLPTYYVYDKYDQLRAVIGSGIEYTDTLNMWRYGYDAQGRLTSKGIPGAIREYYTYDEEDRVIRTRRGEYDIRNTYDDFGRVLEVRRYQADGQWDVLEEDVYDAYPASAASLLAVAVPGGNWNGPVKGLRTWSRLCQIGGEGVAEGYVTSVYLYDDKARLSKQVSIDASGNVLKEEYGYNFPGEVTSRVISYTHDNVTDTFTEQSEYDLRGRVTSRSVTLAEGGETVSGATTLYTYDVLGRPSGTTTTTSGGEAFTSASTYTLQGWLSSHSLQQGSATIYQEQLYYDTNLNTGLTPSYTGQIVRKEEQLNYSSLPGTPRVETYQYDSFGHLTNHVDGPNTESYSYDSRGNLLSKSNIGLDVPARTYQYTYDGDRLTYYTEYMRAWPLQSWAFTHDDHGRMTQDGLAGESIAYNHLNLPGKITRNGGTLVKYSYLVDGSKTSALKGNGEGLVYRGSLIYRRASDGTLSLESAAFAEGMLTPAGVHYHVTDHLGSVRAVVDGESGVFLEAGKYDAYGSREEQMTGGASDATLRWHFTGKEDQGPDFGTAYTDFGARQYSPSLRRWLVPDPLSEKYYDVSPYVYCNDNPVNMVDPDGKRPRIYIQGKGIGHVFITTGEGLNTRVYSYGRYGAVTGPLGLSITSGRFSPRGEGVLFIGEGQVAADYMNKVVKEGQFVMYEFNIDNEEAINDHFISLFNSGDTPSSSEKKESYLNLSYSVIDQYRLLSNNCVTTTKLGLSASGWQVKSKSVIPSFFSGFLFKESEKTEKITYYDEEEAGDYVRWLVSILNHTKNN